MTLCKAGWILTVTDNKNKKDEENENDFFFNVDKDYRDGDNVYVSYKRDNAVKQALELITTDNGKFKTREDMNNVINQLWYGCYVDEAHGKTYTIEEDTEEEWDSAEWELWVEEEPRYKTDGEAEDEE